MDSNHDVHWKETLEHGEKIGLGTREYELHVIKQRACAQNGIGRGS